MFYRTPYDSYLFNWDFRICFDKNTLVCYYQYKVYIHPHNGGKLGYQFELLASTRFFVTRDVDEVTNFASGQTW